MIVLSQNRTIAARVTRSVAVISLPHSQVKMTGQDMEWQEKITRVVWRVARDLIINDEGESSVVAPAACSRTWAPGGCGRASCALSPAGALSARRSCRSNGRLIGALSPHLSNCFLQQHRSQ